MKLGVSQLVRAITLFVTMAIFGAAVHAPLAAQTAAKSSSKGSSKKSAAPAADLVDINHATAAELKTLPGIGDAYSAAIIKGRPYKNKTQLRSGGLIPEATYNKIRDKIIAKQ
jgi:DNA uptake protein ComE-like DNA-binding protein